MRGFKQRDHGTLINIGSIVGYSGCPGTSAYSVTKAYVLTFTWNLQAELLTVTLSSSSLRLLEQRRKIGIAQRSTHRLL
ncbi:MAG: SDR family NAD(P)-dependent oxidoreductase [Acidobacteria bacterium]|nr:SDR family NAD(P)-dependent oxidoreductase [Acidobacteriota bacterium]